MISYLGLSSLISLIVTIFWLVSMMYTFKNNPKINKDTDILVTEQPIIVKFKNDSYDITKFLLRHPGGKQILIDNNGKNIEQLMCDNNHSKCAYNILEKYKIK